MAHPDIETFASMVERYRAGNDVPVERIAAALAVLAAGEAPLLLKDDLHGSDLSDQRRPGSAQHKAGSGDHQSAGKNHQRTRSNENRGAGKKLRNKFDSKRVIVKY